MSNIKKVYCSECVYLYPERFYKDDGSFGYYGDVCRYPTNIINIGGYTGSWYCREANYVNGSYVEKPKYINRNNDCKLYKSNKYPRINKFLRAFGIKIKV